MSIPLVCRSLDDDLGRNSLSIKYPCRYSTGSQTHAGMTDGLVERVSLSRVSVDTVSSLGDAYHDAERLSRRSLVGKDHIDVPYHGHWHGCLVNESPEVVDVEKCVAYSNVAAILAMDGASVQSYPCWMTSSSNQPTHEKNIPRSSEDRSEMKTNQVSKTMIAQHSIAMLQNALETVMNSRSSSFAE